MNINLKKIGIRLKELRVKHNLTQREVAGILNITSSTYSKYENGKLVLSFSKLIALAKLYNISADYILDFKMP